MEYILVINVKVIVVNSSNSPLVESKKKKNGVNGNSLDLQGDQRDQDDLSVPKQRKRENECCESI